MKQTVSDQNFEQIIKSSPVALVDFWAPWCGPCRALAPIIDEIAQLYEGRITVASCNVDDCEETAFNCGIRNVPTLIYYKDGVPAERSAGLVNKAAIEAALENLL